MKNQLNQKREPLFYALSWNIDQRLWKLISRNVKDQIRYTTVKMRNSVEERGIGQNSIIRV